MSESSRYRVTGAVFLIAVAVIVLPMLFDGAGLETAPLEPMDSQPVAAEAVAAPQVDEPGVAQADSLRDQLDDDAFDRESGVRLGDPRLTDAADQPTAPIDAWAVQLASFTDHDKAVALRDRLHRDGYSALLSDIKRVTGVSTRVAVGPIIERAEADRLSSVLSKRYDTDAIVVRFDQ
ncbi:MAG: hypothetical protein HC809_09900 [Gammaproteobacteria bacterium]|nr:hypothetical protein [Gammaproteobacteria bacterium]